MESEIMFKDGIMEIVIHKQSYDKISFNAPNIFRPSLELSIGEASQGFTKRRVMKAIMFEGVLECIIFNPPDHLYDIRDDRWEEAHLALSKYIFENINDSQLQSLLLWIPKMVMGKGLKEGQERVKQKIRTQLGL